MKASHSDWRPIERILVIQTAFLGDVILATALLESLREARPHAELHLMVRAGNEGILAGHPYLKKVWVWNKKQNKLGNLLRLATELRQYHFHSIINLQRFFSTGWLTVLAHAENTAGFDKNPWSGHFTYRTAHRINGPHEVERNLHLGQGLYAELPYSPPRLYPRPADYQRVEAYTQAPFVTLAPGSVWFTKRAPAELWGQLIAQLDPAVRIYLIGGPEEQALCQALAESDPHGRSVSLAGELGLLASAALMEKAVLNYCNDSAPIHLASARNAPVCALFLSTSPEFGFGPLSDFSRIVRTSEDLPCWPCGLAGKAACPEKHFRCGTRLTLAPLLDAYEQAKAWQVAQSRS